MSCCLLLYENIIESFDAMRQMDHFVTFQDITVHSEEKDSYVKMTMTIVVYIQEKQF